MIADILILALILGYCGYVVHRRRRDGHAGGCSGCCGSCSGCSHGHAASQNAEAQSAPVESTATQNAGPPVRR